MAYDENGYLKKLCRLGLAKHYGIKNALRAQGTRERNVVARLDSELEIIERTGLAGRFLFAWDVVKAMRLKHMIMGPGRGPEAGSLVCYLLGITGIDPLKYGLFMERFINPDRKCQPSFILESCKDGHYAIIDYIKRRCGRDRTAHIFTAFHRDLITTMRDIARAQRVPSKKITHLLMAIHRAAKADSKVPPEKLQALNRELSRDPAIRKLMDGVHVIEELCRDSAFDFSGIVIGDVPLQKRIPVGMTSGGVLIALRDEIEDADCMTVFAGGSRFLGAIAETLRILKKKGVRLALASIPLNDSKTLKVIRDENAFGVFQYEDERNDVVERIAPDRFELLIACACLGCPGPSMLYRDYLDRKNRRGKIRYDHPSLEPVLRETYGIFLYQEQMMEAVHVLTGCTLGQGDLFRRTLSKMRPDDVKREHASFVEGCRRMHGIPATTANRIFGGMSEVAGYLFNKSQAVCSATLAYRLAYLKAHYLNEFEQWKHLETRTRL